MRPGRWMLLSCILVQLSLSMPCVAGAQDNSVFEARSDARQIVLGGFFEVVFTLKNAAGDNFQPPGFSDFQVISGPNALRSTSIVKGRVFREMGFAYTLAPKRIGKFTIGSATIRVDGQTLRTQPLRVEIVKAKKEKEKGGEQVFLRAELDTKEAYPGQQILLDYKLYFKDKNIEASDIVLESDYQGFFARDIRRYDTRRSQEVINGQQYTVLTIKRVALFPQRIGQLSIDGLSMQLGILEEAPPSNNFPSLFFNRQLTRVAVTSEPVTISIKPLPDGAPELFSGAVGTYEMTTSLSRTELSTDDALSVRLAVRGNGDNKRIQPPSLIFPKVFEVYEPKIVEEVAFDQDGQLMNETVFEFLLLPTTAGTFSIAPKLGVFDPSTNKYTTVQDETVEVTVTQGKGIRQPMEPDGFEALKDDPASFANAGVPWTYVKGLLWIVLGVLLIAGMVWGRKYFRKLSEQRTAAEMHLERAEKIAKSHLSTAQGHLQIGQSSAFYEEVSRALLGYACRKFNIPLAELNRENLQQKLRETSLPPEQIAQFSQLVKTCDMALYAGMDNAPKMEETYKNAQAILVEMERFLK
ncbi:MAG: BatD family protein [Saprospiraceae bacterium]|nr:BatD family protein [Saprospiraceae bacterium]MDZ4703402.1 BatD family protein [Saprospiraceae bacterium]